MTNTQSINNNIFEIKDISYCRVNNILKIKINLKYKFIIPNLSNEKWWDLAEPNLIYML